MPELVGVPLHVINQSGEVVRSFGGVPTEPISINFWTRWRPVTVTSDDHVWMGLVNRYRLESWSAAGTRQRVLERRSSWFEPWENHSGDVARDRPPSRLLSIATDEEGLIWTLVQVADANYKPLYPNDGRERPMYDIRDEAKISDTIIEVIDPRAARVVARQRFPEALNWFFGRGLVSEVNQNDEDDAEIRVHRLRLVRP